MKSIRSFIRGVWPLVLSALVSLGASAGAADTNSVRIAIGPFFAPAGNQPLENIATALPDLLTASLSQQKRFQLVEREKVNAIWSELHLTEAGLISANSVAKLGRMLSCDWLVSGSFVQTGSSTQIWVKVINTQDSVVLDLQAVPFNGTNLSATADAIAGFLVQTGSRSRPREFIALGKFEDQSISTTREDWAPRLVALLEKYFLAAGYGVVERDAVAPIFSEYQFQAAGLTGDSTNRVKLKPAFWIVDGGCKWIHDTGDKLSVTIRIQKMGGGEQTSNFTESPGEILEKVVISIVQSMLTQMGSTTVAEAQAGEEKIRTAHLEELAKGRGETAPLHYSTNQTFITVTNPDGGTRQLQVDPGFLAQRENHAREMLKTLQQAILLNPKDMRSKWMLGMSWYSSRDAVEKKQGQDLLEEVAASGDATYALKAKNWLADFKSGKLTLEPDRLGNLQIVTHGQPASVPVLETNSVARNIASLNAKVAEMNRHTNAATRAEAVVQLSALPEGGSFSGVTAVKLWKRIVLIACGTTLQSYDLDANSTHEVGLPIKLKNSISAIEADADVLWLGTSGGLTRVSLSDGTVREFTEKDGFPTPAITALRLAGGRLFIGFNGAFGYLDISTGKFTGLMAGANLRKNWAQAMQEPPAGTICSITTLDGTNFWISSQQGFQHFDFGSNKWSMAAPMEITRELNSLSGNSISINSNYLVVRDSMHCAAACRLPGSQWTRVDVVTNRDDDDTTAIALDPAEPDYLWIGGFQGKVTLLDQATSKIIGEGTIPSPKPGLVQWILPTPDKVVCMAGSPDGSCSLHCLDKSALFASMPAAKAGRLDEITNVAVKSEHPVPITQNPGVIAYLNDGPITACSPGRAFGKGQLLVACGTVLRNFDWSGGFGFGSGAEFETVNLPLKMEHPITAIAADEQDLWLGTDGGGLIRIPQSGAAPATFTEKNGFPMSSIRSLVLMRGRLLIGFGRGMDGSFGYLDTTTLTFTGTKPSGISLKTAEESLQPPPRHSVWQIKSPDGTNNYWIACDSALYRLKFDSQEWSLQLPSHNLPDRPLVGGWKTLAAFKNCVATIISSGGVAIYNVSDDRWTHLNLSTNRNENDITTLTIDADKPNYLWLGGHGKITILDMATQKIVCECPIAFHDGAIEYMAVYPGDIFFIEEVSGSYQLMHWNKPNLL